MTDAPDLPGVVVAPSPAGWVARVDLPSQEQACTVARRTARRLLLAWDVPDEEPVHDVLVVVSELVGNAVRHGVARVVLELALGRDGVTVAVTDGGRDLPRQRAGDDHGESGRGLTIVDALARTWGVEELPPGGKRVWAVLAR